MFSATDILSLQGRSMLIAVATLREFHIVSDGLKRLCRVNRPWYTATGGSKGNQKSVLCHKYVHTIKAEGLGSSTTEDVVTESSKRFTYVVLRAGAGPEEHGTTAAAAMALLKPKHAVLIGVCAADGMPHHARKGDVVMASKAFNYEEGMWTQQMLEPRTILQTASQEDSLEAYRKAHQSAVFGEGVICISGTAVRADSPDFIQQATASQHLQSAVLDMEASSFIRACLLTGTDCLGVVKAVLMVTDPARLGEDPEYAERAGDAAERGIQYAQWFLKAHGEADDGLIEPYSKLASQYYQGYISHLEEYVSERGQTLHVVMLEPNFYAGNHAVYDQDIGHLVGLDDLGAERATTPSAYSFFKVGDVCFDILRSLRCIREIDHPGDEERMLLYEEALMSFRTTLEKHLRPSVKVVTLSGLKELLRQSR